MDGDFFGALLIAAVTTAAFFALYTAYDKKTKGLDFHILSDLFLVRRGWDFTLVETNKVLSLAGLTLLALAFCPQLEAMSWDLLWIAQLKLWTHSAYSAFKFYGTNNIPALSSWPGLSSELSSNSAKVRAVAVKKISILLGVAGQLAISAAFLGLVSGPLVTCWLAVGLGTAHFYTMEVNFKWALGIRPFAYIVFPIVTLALVWTAVTAVL